MGCESMSEYQTSTLVSGRRSFKVGFSHSSPHSAKMRLALAVVFAFLFVAAWSMHVPRDYAEQSEYRRRKDSEKVKQKLVEHWSRPEVLNGLPSGMKVKVESYIKKFPEYQWKPGTSHSSDTGSESESKRKTGLECANQ